MDGVLAATGGGLVLGLLTAVSPCPLATNLAATVWLARHAASRRRALLGALAYTAGRVAAYGAVAAVLVLGALGAPELSTALQHWLPPFVGPLLVLTAMVLLELLPLPWASKGMSQETAARLARLGLVGEFLLGVLFALTFCPTSAALFFGSLLPQALAGPASAPPVIAYGIGTAVPIGVFSFAVAIGANFASRFSENIVRWQPRIRVAAGIGLLLIGGYLIARDTLHVIPT
ncbi:MAG: sulfite exporter TauE/SafE family protein [Planctomycetes bacterium]|nr:sulfite exporter TauE/SafE family protein [Planctomycetota bacterium]